MSPAIPAFDYTSGNPDNLTGGTGAAMSDIQGPFYDIRNYLNSGVLAQLQASSFIVGEVRFIAVPNAPALWLACTGQAVSRSTYSALFAAVGTAYGSGDGTTTFNVPDLQGRAPVGVGTGAGLTARTIGTKWGVEAITLTAAQSGLRDHRHTYLLPTPSTSGTAGGNSINAGANGSQNTSYVIDGLAGAPAQSAHDNTQPSLAIPAYIYAGA